MGKRWKSFRNWPLWAQLLPCVVLFSWLHLGSIVLASCGVVPSEVMQVSWWIAFGLYVAAVVAACLPEV